MAEERPQEDAYHLAGDRLGKFVILAELGRGSMGVVYEALQEDLKRKVALKILPANITLAKKQVQRFHREAESVARLRHDNVIQVYEVGEIDKTHYFAMELVDGEPLSEHLKRSRKDQVEVAAAIARDAARGLAHAHGRGVIHRDVKPSNLLVDRSGRVVVTDFGLARLSDSGSLTSTDAIVGTPKYMSPEQILPVSKIMDGRTDVYSLGATLYEAVAGRPPFEEPSVQAFITAILEQRPASPRRFNKAIPHDLATIILRCLEKEPEDRYPGAQELADDLDRFLAGERIHAKPKGAVALAIETVRRHKIIASLAAVAILALVLSLVLGGQAARLRSDAGIGKELNEILELDDLELAIARMDDLAASEPKHTDVRNARARVYDRHAHKLLEDPQPHFGRILESLEQAGKKDEFWHLMMLVEAFRLDEAKTAAGRLPDGPLKNLLLARLDFEAGRFAEAIQRLGAAPVDAEPVQLLVFHHFVKGQAHHGLADSKSGGDESAVDWEPNMRAAKQALQEARREASRIQQKWLYNSIALQEFNVRRRLGEAGVQLSDLIADTVSAFGETQRRLLDFWGSMSAVETRIFESFRNRLLGIAGQSQAPLAIIESVARARIESSESPRARAIANLVLSAVMLSRGRFQQAADAINAANNEPLGDAGLTTYVHWGKSLVFRAQNDLDQAIFWAITTVQGAPDDFPDLASVAEHATLLAEKAKSLKQAENAQGIADVLKQRLEKLPQREPWVSALLARINPLAAVSAPGD